MTGRDENAIEHARRLAEAEERALGILGLERGATMQEIRAAYRSLAKKYHPDANRGDESAKTRFNILRHAYAFLSGEIKEPPVIPDAQQEDGINPANSDKYNTDNPWGMFLWWKERFF